MADTYVFRVTRPAVQVGRITIQDRHNRRRAAHQARHRLVTHGARAVEWTGFQTASGDPALVLDDMLARIVLARVVPADTQASGSLPSRLGRRYGEERRRLIAEDAEPFVGLIALARHVEALILSAMTPDEQRVFLTL